MVYGQTVTVDRVEFAGHDRTREDYLRQFVEAKPNRPTTDSLLRLDAQRLQNLTPIGQVQHRLDTLDEVTILTFEVTEVKTLLPIVNLGGIRDNFWFQLGFTDLNWRGNGSTLSAAYFNNDSRHGGHLFYRNPRWRGTPWGFSAALSRWASVEPLYFQQGAVNYDYDNNSLGLTVLRNLGYHHQVEAGGTFFVEQYRKSATQSLETPPGPDELTQPKFLTKWEHRGNYLNYHLFYLDGTAWRTTFQNVHNLMDGTWFHSLQFQGRHFRRLGKRGNLATRLTLAIATNNNSPFAPFVADSHVNIRGIGNRIDRGTAQIVVNLEYRQTLFENSKWAAQAVAFSDLGTWRNPGGRLRDLFDSNQFREFVGGGVRLLNQKWFGAVLRIDYGVDLFNPNQRGLVIGLGQYF